MADLILTVNAGSSSLKFAVYEAAHNLTLKAKGQVSGLASGVEANLQIDVADARLFDGPIKADGHVEAFEEILKHGRELFSEDKVVGVGHRVVHGGITFDKPVVLTSEVIEELRSFEPLAPLHQPHNLASVDAAKAAFTEAIHVAGFDTAFHRTHPWVNDTFCLPRKWYDEGVRRYGFHGLSYDYITSWLREHRPDLASGRVVIAHLGNGASMCAVRDGKSVGSTMGFSALDGLPMGTRCGQIDPGVLLYMMDQKGMSAEQISDLLYKESGLKGLSGKTNDMRVLEASDEPACQQAIDYFVFRIRRELGGMSAVLGGLDGVIFCGGIGENSAFIRQRICEGMEWLGISLDENANAGNEIDISRGTVSVLAVPTNEEIVLARAAFDHLQ
ncbi:MAG: acetate/propionate family kinase [Pseudomonadota bacterium]